MRFLPKANPLYEKIAADNIVIPDILEKLGKGGFSGYIQHLAPGFEFYGIFAQGRLLSALGSENGRDSTDFEALLLLFDKVISSGGEINVYRMTADLAVCAHALTIGPRMYTGEEVRQEQIKGILSSLKGQNMNGVVRFYTTARSAMMFYKGGLPIGFYHDGADSIGSSPDEVRKIAALPGAQFEICSTKTLDELMLFDLLQIVNLQNLWEAVRLRNVSSTLKETAGVASAITEQQLLELVDDISEVASAYLSREGRAIVANRIEQLGGPSLLLDGEKRALFIAQIKADATVSDSLARIDEMVDLITSEIAGRLAL